MHGQCEIYDKKYLLNDANYYKWSVNKWINHIKKH